MDVTLYAKAISNLLGNDVGFSLEGVDYFSLSINGDKNKPSETAITEEVARLQSEYGAEQIQIEADKESAVSKLEALGLTDAEIKALSGGL